MSTNCQMLTFTLLTLSHVMLTAISEPLLFIGLKHSDAQIQQLHNHLMKMHDPVTGHTNLLEPIHLQSMMKPSQQAIRLVTEWITSVVHTKHIEFLPSGDILKVTLHSSHESDEQPPPTPMKLKPFIDFIVLRQDKPNLSEDLETRPTYFRKLTTQEIKAGLPGTPQNQRIAYDIPENTRSTSPRNLQLVWGPGTYGYTPSDLTKYNERYCSTCKSADTSFATNNHGKPGGDNFGEGTLDTQIIQALGNGAHTLVSNTNTSASTEETTGFGAAFLDFLIMTNEIPTNNVSLPYVISLSLGSLSWYSCDLLCSGVAKMGTYSKQQCEGYMKTQRQICMYLTETEVLRSNVEMMKLGSRGVSIFAATGDGGAHFSFHRFSDSNPIGKQLNEISCHFGSIPTFPAASPYTIGVGGVVFQDPTSVPEGWSGSGSGFSWAFNETIPSAKEVVGKYLQSTKGPPTRPSDAVFNTFGRGYPDVSALSTEVPVVMRGFPVATGGTSASTPAFAGMISLVNDYRLKNGKKPLGFFRPRLYDLLANDTSGKVFGELFTDVVSGNSKDGCDLGFPATKGWDAQTGFGTPKFPGWLKYFG